MRMRTAWAWAGAAIVGLCAPLLAQDREETGTKRVADIYMATEVIGMNVVQRDGDKLGDVRDLVTDGAGHVRYVVVGVGGLAGVGEEHVAVPIDRIDFDKTDDGEWRLVLPMSSEDLKRAPRLKSDTYTELADENWLRSNREFFKSTGAKDLGAGGILRVSKILKTRIVGASADRAEMGRVEDLILNHEWKLAFAILGSGGILNVGSDFIAVPFDRITFRSAGKDDVEVSVNATAEQLRKAPLVERKKYSRLTDPQFVDQLKAHFGEGASGTSPTRTAGSTAPTGDGTTTVRP